MAGHAAIRPAGASHRARRAGCGRCGALAGVVLAALMTAAASRDPSSAHAMSGPHLTVVATVNMWGSITSQLAGTKATVTSIVTNPNVDPHSYEATPADGRSIASARFVVENGIGYDPWAQRLLDASPSGRRMVLNVGQLLGVPADGNPHQWYSPDSVQRFTDRVTADLQRLDPKDAVYFARRHAAFERALEPYHALIAQIAARYGGTPVSASESIFAPLASALNVRLLTPASFLRAVSEGNEPTAADKATVDDQIRRHAIKVFVLNSQNSTPDIARLVDECHHERIPVVSVTETLAPASSTFQAWQSRQLERLLAALASASSSTGSTPSS